MQDEYDRIYRSYSRKPAPPSAQDNEDEYDAIYLSARKVAPPAPAAPEKPPLWDRIKDVGRAVAADPLGAAKSVGKGLVQNVTDLGSLAQLGSNPAALSNIIAEEAAKGDGAEKRLMARGVGAASLMVPAARVGGAATSFLVNTAANAGLGAAQTPDDPMLGATLGAVIPAGISATSKLAGMAVGKLGKAASKIDAPVIEVTPEVPRDPRRIAVSPDAPTEKALAKLEEAAAKTEKKLAEAPLGSKQSTKLAETAAARRTLAEKARLAVERRKASTLPALEETPVNDLLLIQEEAARVAATERTLQGINDSVVRPGAARAPIADGSFPEGYTATADKPLPEVTALPGQKPIIDPEVKASRVADERLATAEQREAERLMTKEVKAIDKEAADEAAAAIADAEKAAKQAQKDTEKATKTLTQEKAKAAREAEKAALTADRAAQAAAKAAKLQADAAALEAAKAVGKDAVKEVRAQQAAEKAAQRAADAQAKADFAAQAALDAQAKRALADETAAKTVADMTPPSTETAAGMLNTANAQYNRTQRGKMAAQAALARRKPLNVAPVVDQVEGASPVASVAPIAPVDAPVAPLAAPLTPSNAPAIPEVQPAPVVAPTAPVVPEAPAAAAQSIDAPAPLPPADKPFLNWRTLGVDPSKPDALSMNVSARVKAAAERPEMVERLRAERGSTTWAAMNAKAQESWAIRQLGIDPLSVDSNKLRGLSGEQIHALKAPLLENAGLMEGIARELPNLEGDDLVKATATFDALERSNDELLATIQREGSARGRDLNALRQVAQMTTDPAVWLVKAKRALGDQPMTKEITARIMKLAKEATEACGGA